MKHFFLERYLERVAYVTGSRYPSFVYVDGFSGPWKCRDDRFEDTSFIIAIQKLRAVRDGLAERGIRPRIRCLFIEKDPRAFSELQRAICDVSDIEVAALHGEFEQLIARILQFIDGAFSLVFIDPTGWTGFGLQRITPILEHRPGEVIINFMYDYINRFIADREYEASFDNLMGGPAWRHLLHSESRERDFVAFYRDQIRVAGGFPYATWTRILKPLQDRSYFYLYYATRHIKGLKEFRKVEKSAVEIQERVRLQAKLLGRVARSRQAELFSADMTTDPRSFEFERTGQNANAEATLRELLHSRKRVSYEEAIGAMLQMPLVWESDVQAIVRRMREVGEVDIDGLNRRERTFKAGHTLLLKTADRPAERNPRAK